MKKINKEQYDKLPDFAKEMYSETEDGSYELTIDSGDDVGALKRAKDREVARRKKAESAKQELEDKLKEYSEKDDELSRKRGDVEALESSWKNKYNKIVEEKDGVISKLQGQLKNVLVDSAADNLANSLTKHPHLLKHFIEKRLSVDLESDIPSTRVLDLEGKPSAMSLDELKEEFRSNDAFSAIITGSKASGGGSPTTPAIRFDSGGAQATKQKKLSEMTEAEALEHITNRMKSE